MPIKFHCSHCGKMVKAPDEAGGKRGRCPSCKESVYVPLPPDEDEAIPLAPIDDQQEKADARARAESSRAAAALDHEDRIPPEGAMPSRTPETAAAIPTVEAIADVGKLIERFVQAMSDSKLDHADRIANQLRTDRRRTKAAVQQLMLDEIPPASLGDIPPPLVKGFLKNLQGRL
ncbi:MAG: hypothetical protein IID37_00115 [Planctomycetes bacterium]|nr:hypothetical protein [Planctomycetota bacterium]